VRLWFISGFRKYLRDLREIHAKTDQIKAVAIDTHQLVLENKDTLKRLAKRIQCGPRSKSKSRRATK
jgi:hypothetical protein